MPIPKAVARFNRYVTNPVVRTFAGRVRPFAVVLHQGRKSGRQYRTPVWAFRAGNAYVIPLTYGADSEWVDNVLAARGCGFRRLGLVEELTDPRIVRGAEGLAMVPAIVRGPLRALGVSEFLRLSNRPAV